MVLGLTAAMAGKATVKSIVKVTVTTCYAFVFINIYLNLNEFGFLWALPGLTLFHSAGRLVETVPFPAEEECGQTV